jgi:predicted TIM-barrel fold metal-dependent hydrolase
MSRVKGTPEHFSRVISAFPDLRIVLAHMGGFHMWEEAERHVLGKKIWIDTAYCTVMPDEKIRRIINIHGADRVLFGSDFPWQRASDIRKKLETSIENIRDREKIFHENAEKLLGI